MGQNESTQKTPVDLDIEEKEQVERDSAKFEEDVVDVFDEEVENIIESSRAAQVVVSWYPGYEHME